MPHGNNHAKQIVIDEANDLVDKLQNGHGADPGTQGKATGLLIRMIIPLFQAELVTVQECAENRSNISERVASEIRSQSDTVDVLDKPNGKLKIKVGPVEISGSSNPVVALGTKALTLVPFGVLFYMMGKLLEWW